MSVRSSRRRGIALISALALLALLGLLMAGALASATLAQHALHASLADGPLLGAADYAIGVLLADPARFDLADLPLGSPEAWTIVIPGGPRVRASVTATRLPSGIYWIVGAAALDDPDSARRRIGVVARTAWVGKPPSSPFVARGATTLAPSVRVEPDSGGEPGCAAATVPDPRQSADSTEVFAAPSQWETLAAARDARVVGGDTTITGGAFQGILMVGGDLTIAGPFAMTGLVVARGRIRASGAFQITGALVSQAGGPGAAIDLRDGVVRHAPCVVNRLLRRASPIRAARRWGWTELF